MLTRYQKEKKIMVLSSAPLVMDINGRWLANTLSKLEIRVDGRKIRFSTAAVSATYYPGLLKQEIIAQKVGITQRLIFVSKREALIETIIMNRSHQTIDCSARVYRKTAA